MIAAKFARIRETVVLSVASRRFVARMDAKYFGKAPTICARLLAVTLRDRMKSAKPYDATFRYFV